MNQRLEPLSRPLRRCRTMIHLQSVHGQATTAGLAAASPADTFTALLYAFIDTLHHHPWSFPSSTSSIDYVIALFHRIPDPSSAFPYNLLIRAHAVLSSPPLPALRLFADMRRLAVPPDSHTFPFLLKACAGLRSLTLARALHAQSLRFGFAAADAYVRNALITAYATCASLLDARGLFEENPACRDVVTYNALIDGFVKAGDVALARKLFDEMPERDVVSWGSLLAGYSQTGQFEEAVGLFDRMISTGTRPDEVALVSVLSCCAHLGALDRGVAVHEYIKANRVGKLNVYLSTGLVDMYAKCGCISVAREVFESTPRKNLFTWNAIIVGLAMHGHGELSLDYFSRMRGAGVYPDGVTFLGAFVACSHAGLVDMARSMFAEMETVYGVERELKHYGCMADLLGRAGLIKEAMEMIEGMPMEGDIYVWGGLLAGCRIHGNVDVAEIAAQHLLELSPDDSGIYSIMAGIYAAAKRWEDVDRMRKLMGDRGVRKNVGWSFIEVNGMGHQPALEEVF